MVDRFLQEARAASSVGSHRVVQIFDVGRFEDGARYLLMEYVAGRSLAEVIKEMAKPRVAMSAREHSYILRNSKSAKTGACCPLSDMLCSSGGKVRAYHWPTAHRAAS